MKKTMKTLAILVMATVMWSFTQKHVNQFVGTYGVAANDPSQIKLIIHSDHTFYYQDFSSSNNKIIANGNWSVKGSKLVLAANEAKQKFHDVWTFDKNGKVAKSRKGLAFYRLRKAE